jgi:hypothetical protein
MQYTHRQEKNRYLFIKKNKKIVLSVFKISCYFHILQYIYKLNEHKLRKI